MKKKLLTALLLTAIAGVASATVVGCTKNDNPDGDKGNGGNPTEHVCDFDTEHWSNDDTHHYHKCKVDGCNKVNGSEEHKKTTRNTATCTEDGEIITECSVEGCNYSVSTPQKALGHDWDEENAQPATHLHAGVIECKREGCTDTKPITQLPHTYVWTEKDATTHTGKCNGEDCAEVPAVEQSHNFEETTVGAYTVHTCKDCGAEYADVSVKLLSGEDQSGNPIVYAGENVKVTLHKVGDGNYTQAYEATATAGVASFKVKEGAYWISVQDPAGLVPANVYLIKFDKSTAETDLAQTPVKLTETAQYTYRLKYGSDTPASGVSVTVRPNYKYGEEFAQTVFTGTTDENGEITFTERSAFAGGNANKFAVEISGFDNENYFIAQNSYVNEITEAGVTERRLAPRMISHKVTLKTEDGTSLDGATVKLTVQRYVDENDTPVTGAGNGTWKTFVVATAVSENGAAQFEPLDNNTTYGIEVELTEEQAKNWKLKYATSNKITDFFGEVEIEFVSKSPTYILSVSGPATKQGITLIVTDGEGAEVARQTTNEEGKISVELPLAEYTVTVDEATVPAGFTLASPVVVPTTQSNGRPIVNSSTNSVSYTVILSELSDVAFTVKQSTNLFAGIVIKLYQKGELKYTSQPTNEQGVVNITCIKGQSYDVVLEGLPENMAQKTLTATPYNGKATITLVADVLKYNLTLKDAEGNALSGATVNLNKMTWSSRNAKYTEAVVAKATSDGNGLAVVKWQTGTFYVSVTASDGKTYWGNLPVTAETVQDVNADITVYPYDVANYQNNTFEYACKNQGKEVVTVLSSNLTTMEFTTGDLNSVAGTYKISFDNPLDIDLKFLFKYNITLGADLMPVFDSMTEETAEDNEFFKFTKDANGKITAVEVTFDGTKAVRFEMSLPVGYSEPDLLRLGIKVEKLA